MQPVVLDVYSSAGVGVVALLLGLFLTRTVPFLKRFCIPAPVSGGLIISLFTLLLYVVLGLECSFDGTVRRWNSEALSGWQAEEELLSAENARVERIMLSLRTDTGVEAAYLHRNCREDTLDGLLAAGELVEEGGRIRIPESRWFVSDGIIRELI